MRLAKEKDIGSLWPDKQFILTLVVTTPEFLKNHADVVRRVLEVHHAWTVRLQREPQAYVAQLEERFSRAELKQESARWRSGFVNQAGSFCRRSAARFDADDGRLGLRIDFRRPADLTGSIDSNIIDAIRSQKR